MNSNQRNEVKKVGYNIGARPSTYDDRNQITSSGKEIKHRGTNRTIVDNKTYYGHSDAIKAIKKLK
ncbi:hypothetical protein [Niastella populi]|nr:hypothetical protein [Niastella populi]